MIRINLLPAKAARKKEQLLGQLILLVIGIVLTFVVCIGAYGILLGKVSAEKDLIAAKEAEISKLKKALGEVAQFKKLQAELRGKLDVLDQLKDGKTGPVHLLDKLITALPEKVWLTSFKENAGSISISGFGMNEESVAQFLRDLEASPNYQGVELQVIEQVLQGGAKVHKFDITCRADFSVAKLAGNGGGK
jgi:type IV pilus assembly protein PilN